MPAHQELASGRLLRQACVTDAAQLRRLQQAIYLEDIAFVGDGPMTESRIAQRIRSLYPDQSQYLVIEEQGQHKRLCAWLELHRLNAKRLNHVATMTLAVDKDYRNQNLASALLEFAMAWAIREGVCKIALNVKASNVAAIKLYEKYGFVVEGKEKHHIKTDNGFEDNWIMAKFLNTEGTHK